MVTFMTSWVVTSILKGQFWRCMSKHTKRQVKWILFSNIRFAIMFGTAVCVISYRVTYLGFCALIKWGINCHFLYPYVRWGFKTLCCTYLSESNASIPLPQHPRRGTTLTGRSRSHSSRSYFSKFEIRIKNLLITAAQSSLHVSWLVVP